MNILRNSFIMAVVGISLPLSAMVQEAEPTLKLGSFKNNTNRGLILKSGETILAKLPANSKYIPINKVIPLEEVIVDQVPKQKITIWDATQKLGTLNIFIKNGDLNGYLELVGQGIFSTSIVGGLERRYELEGSEKEIGFIIDGEFADRGNKPLAASEFEVHIIAQ